MSMRNYIWIRFYDILWSIFLLDFCKPFFEYLNQIIFVRTNIFLMRQVKLYILEIYFLIKIKIFFQNFQIIKFFIEKSEK